jgi:hypothetical protein
MNGRRTDATTMAAGIAAIVVGVVLALHEGGTIDLAGGWIVVLACAAAGIVLIVDGVAWRGG